MICEGKSTGTPTEKGLEIDAETVLKFASQHPRYTHTLPSSLLTNIII